VQYLLEKPPTRLFRYYTNELNFYGYILLTSTVRRLQGCVASAIEKTKAPGEEHTCALGCLTASGGRNVTQYVCQVRMVATSTEETQVILVVSLHVEKRDYVLIEVNNLEYTKTIRHLKSSFETCLFSSTPYPHLLMLFPIS
jgi:hypothetical protein